MSSLRSGSRVVRLLSVLIAASLLCGAQSRSALLEVRLRNHLTSYSSPPGTRFKCAVLKSLMLDGRAMIPQGSIIFGSVRKAQAVGIGLLHERAALDLRFDAYETPDGDRYPLSATLVSIDNAREEVTREGKIKGVLAANNPGNLLNGFWVRPSSNLAFRSLIGLTGAANQVWARYSMGPIGAAGLLIVRCALVSFPEPEIHLTPGTDLELKVKLPVDPSLPEIRTVADRPLSNVVPMRTSAFDDDDALRIRNRLSRISHANGASAPDMLNVVLIGSSEEVVTAFLGSGWSLADVRSIETLSRTYEAFSSMHNYASAPVSTLLYRGAAPELVFEKSFDTVAQRHHVRFWRAGEINGKQIWLGAATHDTGVGFRFSTMRFTHRIDSNLDRERDKIATDLTFSGCSTQADYLDRYGQRKPESTGHVITDGRLLVLEAQECSAITGLDEPPRPPGNRLTRVTRRVVLESRNYLLRDNAYYWGYRLVKSAYNRVAPLVH